MKIFKVFNLTLLLVLVSGFSVANAQSSDNLEEYSSFKCINAQNQILEVKGYASDSLHISIFGQEFVAYPNDWNTSYSVAFEERFGGDGIMTTLRGEMDFLVMPSFPPQASVSLTLDNIRYTSFHCHHVSPEVVPPRPNSPNENDVSQTIGKRVLYHCDNRFIFSAIYYIDNQVIEDPSEGNKAKVAFSFIEPELINAEVERFENQKILRFVGQHSGKIEFTLEGISITTGSSQSRFYRNCSARVEVSGVSVSN